MCKRRARHRFSPPPVARNLLCIGSMTTAGVVRIAAVSDIHYNKTSQGSLQPLFAEITESADVLVLAGDLTDYGLAEEAKVLARDLTASLKIPAVGVLGNHDYE